MPTGRQGLTFPAQIQILLEPSHWRRLPGSPQVLVQAGVPEHKDNLSEHKDNLSEHQLASPSTSQHRIAPCWSLMTWDHPQHIPLSLAASATGYASCLQLPAAMQRKF